MGADLPTINLTHAVTYQGQLKDNKPHGNGKIIYSASENESFTFEGKFTDGEPHYGNLIMKNLTYTGEIIGRRAEGNGKLFNKETNTKYEGKFGKGKLIEGTVIKEGFYRCRGKFCNETTENNQSGELEDLLHGDQASYEDFVTFEEWKGNFWKGNITGEGQYTQAKKVSYKGQFYGGKFTGEGIISQQSAKVKSIEGSFHDSFPKVIKKMQFEDGDCFQGEIKKGLFEGPESSYQFSDGKIYKGNIYQHTFTGECQITYPPNSPVQIYRGEVHEGKFNGLGVLQYRNGVILKGYFNENAKNGPCILVYGDRMFKGLFMMDKLIGCLQQIPKDS